MLLLPAPPRQQMLLPHCDWCHCLPAAPAALCPSASIAIVDVESGLTLAAYAGARLSPPPGKLDPGQKCSTQGERKSLAPDF